MVASPQQNASSQSTAHASQSQGSAPGSVRPLVPGLPPRNAESQGRAQASQQTEQTQTKVPVEGGGREGELIVGEGIVLKGKMERCDTLVVFGEVDAEMSGREIEVGDGGVYTGQAEVENAHIAGSFDGELTVKGTLSIEQTGRVTGKIRYAEVIIDRGGSLSGDVQVLGEDGDSASKGTDRKSAAN